MISLILGGSGSGKSFYAEAYALKQAEGGSKVYLATMQVYDKEGKEKVQRHQKQRDGKGFRTIEQPTQIGSLIDRLHKEDTVLLECMSNLLANEMFSGAGPKDCTFVASKIMEDIQLISKKVKHIVIVSNNVFEDGLQYDEATMEYLRALGEINKGVAKLADQVVEVVVGIPIKMK